MKKLGFILGATTAAMVVATSGVVASHLAKVPERDAQIIVEVNRNVNTLSKEEVKKTQDAVYNNIKLYATTNVRLTKRYNELNNAFVMEVNSNDIESIKKVPGVASVSIDKAHVISVNNNDEGIYIPLNGNRDPQATLGENDNISAATMFKPENTNDGEGTLVAIIDNEFHLKANSTKNSNDAWCHEVFSPLADDVSLRYTFDTIKKITGTHAERKIVHVNNPGVEGSLYFNNKVPFYYDYGGYTTYYAKTGSGDYDVHSERGYHGSHVSSITAANAPTYKGIAPKAQLALMKVSTDFDAEANHELGKKLGFGSGLFMYDSTILTAIEDCIKLRVDGINMSLGTDLNDFDSDSITCKTLNKLADAGILSAISAGNAGKASFASSDAYANWSTRSVETGILGGFANQEANTIVASGHPTQIYYESAFNIAGSQVPFSDQIVNQAGMAEDYTTEYRMRDLIKDDPNKQLDWVYVPGFGTAADYSGLGNVDGKIVVVNRGSTSFADKYNIAANKGAIGLVIINNDPTASDFNFRCSFGDGFTPTIPCALALYKDKTLFATQGSGVLTLISKQISDNPNKYTVSDFSSDGASYSLDLKPDITAPGDNIRGAVPEHAMTNLTKDQQESPEYKYKCYQYLSGTSMAAPNYAGAQALVLSQFEEAVRTRNETYDAIATGTGTITQKNAARDEADAEFNKTRSTIDMRLMSTADPMLDVVENPETNVKNISSPRIQGAGMVDLDGAINTKVYLEGLDLNGNKIGKSKVALRNNPDIAKGDIKISFLAHNETDQAKEYDVKLTVMRPALAHPNDIVTKDYNYRGEVDKIDSFSGKSFYDVEIHAMSVGTGACNYKDVFKVSKDFDYYASEADFNADKKTTITKGYYYNAASEGADWQPLPSYTAQSTRDVVIDVVTGQTVTAQPGESTITINPYSLSEEAKNTILENFEYGCMIEGFVTLDSKDDSPDLSIPYLGFYSGTDRDANASFDNVPVAEPFNFQKDYTKVYPSDLVYDLSKSLIGRDAGNFESMIVAGYVEKPEDIDVDKVRYNNQAFNKVIGADKKYFYNVGSNPRDEEYTNNPSNDIYLGNPEHSNTMIIQQFMLRSVLDNYFTITNKANNKVVYRNALEDIIRGDTMGRWSLFKSHVDSSYLSSGAVAHRAFAIVPLYDSLTGEAFESGEYELKFNYQLPGSGNWVSDSYTLHIDSDAPMMKTACQYRDDNGVERIRFYFEEDKMAYGVVGYYRVDAKYDTERGMYYIDETKDFVYQASEEVSDGGEFRMFIGGVDYARGSTGCIIHLNDYENFNRGFMTVQGTQLLARYEFEYNDGNLVVYDTISGEDVSLAGSKVYLNGFLMNTPVDGQSNGTNHGSANITTNTTIIVATAIIAAVASIVIVSLLLKKRKGGK